MAKSVRSDVFRVFRVAMQKIFSRIGGHSFSMHFCVCRYIPLINQCTLVNDMFAKEIQIFDSIGRVKFYEFMG